MTLLLAVRGTRLHPSKINPSMYFDETIFEPKTSIGATHELTYLFRQ